MLATVIFTESHSYDEILILSTLVVCYILSKQKRKEFKKKQRKKSERRNALTGNISLVT